MVNSIQGMYMAKDDSALIAECREGNQDSFRQLVSKYSNLVGSIAYNIIGDAHISYDITQETFLKAYKNIDTLQDPTKFKGWICSITRTTCIDWLRKEKVKPISLDKMAENGMDPSSQYVGGLSQQTSMEAEELREKVLHVINGLPKIYQEIVLLRHLRNMSYKEISDFLNLPIATIESRLYRARMKLKESLMDLYMYD